MPRWVFVLLAASVTLGGIGAVTWIAMHLGRRLPARAVALGIACLALYAITLWLRPLAWPVIDLAVLIGAVGGILIIERGLRTEGSVVAFLAVAAIVDLVSSVAGPTRLILDRYRSGESDLVLFLTLVAPVRGRLIPIVGIGDLLVGGAAATALLRLGVRASRVTIALGAGLLAALAYGLWRGGAPAIPFLAVAVGLAVWRRRDGTVRLGAT